ncbi:MAG: BatD family protein [Candidatus Anammoxibacter sp.]
MRLTNILIFIVLMFVMELTAFAEEIQLVASVDKTVLTTDDSLSLKITVTGAANVRQPQLPDLQGFNLIFGPSISSRTSIANGAISFSKGFTYVLKPKFTGKLTIGAFTIRHNGKVYNSNTINIEVLSKTANARKRNDSQSLDFAQKVFVEFTTDKNEAYIYEQVVLSFRLFYQAGLPITDLEYVEPETRNFIKDAMGKQRQYEVVRNGIIYNVIELKSALFPVVTGELKIMPAKVQCNLLVKSRRRRRSGTDIFGDPFFDNFFGGNKKKYQIKRQTRSIKLLIKPLPEKDKPSDFNGTVGVYSLEVEIKPTKVNVGDPLTVTMTVRGEGNIQAISEPVLQSYNEKDFKTYPAEIDTTIYSKKEGIKGEKVFKKVIEPQNDAILQTPRFSFSFFNPILEEYKTLSYEPIPIEIATSEIETPIRLYVRETNNDKEQVSIMTKDISPIMANLTSFNDQGKLLYKSYGIFVMFFTPIVAVIVSLFTQRYRKKLKTNVSYTRKKRAHSVVKKRLMGIKRGMENVTPEECYSNLSNAIAEYIADKFNITAASISPDSVTKILGMHNVQEGTINKLVELLDLCDYGRFAKDVNAKEMVSGTIDSTEGLINALEKQLKAI